MYKNRRILAVVPARGGSKGIPLKNLRKVGGKSLVAWAGDCASRVPELDKAICSTNREIIAAEAWNAGLSIIKRPVAISNGDVGDAVVLRHALARTEEIYREHYDVVVMLQPTSPLRLPSDVSAAIYTLINGDWDSVWTVSETDSKHHPSKQLVLRDDGGLHYYGADGGDIIMRQQLKSLYHRNGIAYAMTRECLLEQGTKGYAATGIITDHPSISIDTENDLKEAERLMGETPGFIRSPIDISGYTRPVLDQPFAYQR